MFTASGGNTTTLEVAMPRKVTPLSERFWSRVDRSAEEGCWPWTGTVNNKGYGMIYPGPPATSQVLVHRVAYEFASGQPIPPGVKTLHTCDNPLCVRNDEVGEYELAGVARPRFGHLVLGTQQDNMTDMQGKGRGALGERNSSVMHPERIVRGTAHPRSRLTDDQVREIRERVAAGESQTSLKTVFGVTQARIGTIVRGTSWRHIDGPRTPTVEYSIDGLPIDRRVFRLVTVLNRLPRVRTFSSCGGHHHPIHGQLPHSRFSVSLEIPQNAEGWRAIALILEATGEFNDRISLRPTLNVDGTVVDWELSGMNFLIPDVVAVAIERASP